MSEQCEAKRMMGDMECRCELDAGHDGPHGYCLDWIEFDDDDAAGSPTAPKGPQ